MGAKSRFEQPLTLLGGGNQVVACGPLLFDEDDVLAEVNISLTQPGKGTATAAGVFVKNPLPSSGSGDDDEGVDADRPRPPPGRVQEHGGGLGRPHFRARATRQPRDCEAA